MYRPNDAQLHPLFWEELCLFGDRWDAPWIVGGNFNITRFAKERRGIDHNPRDCEEFNIVINNLRLIGLPINDHLFTWSTMRMYPHLTKLERILEFVNWDAKFPRVESSTLQRPTSDHVPIYLHSRENYHAPKRCIHYKKRWLEHKNVHELIKGSWSQTMSARDVVGNLYCKL